MPGLLLKGFIPFGIDFSAGSADLVRLDAELTEARSLLSSQQQGASAPTSESTTSPLPLGVGILTFHASCTPANFAANLRPILARHRPRVVWLFAPSPPSRDDCQHPHEWLIRELHALGATYPRAPVPAGTVSDAEAAGRHDLDLKVFVQTGHSAAAIEALYMHGADGIVVQGREAGGHQFAACDVGWSVGVPELRMRLTQEHVLLAAGGIATGAVVAAALAVGADGAVMGTRVS